MTELSEEELTKLTHLCRIKCSEEEKKQFLSNLGKILSYISQLEEVDTRDVTPCSQVIPTHHMREDVVEDLLSREAFLSNAPAHIGGMIRVPPIIKSSS